MNDSTHTGARSVLTITAVSVFSFFVIVLSGCNGQATEDNQPAPPQVGFAVVTATNITQWDELSGGIETVETVELRFRVSGHIESVNYKEGQEVMKDNSPFTIDSRG